MKPIRPMTLAVFIAMLLAAAPVLALSLADQNYKEGNVALKEGRVSEAKKAFIAAQSQDPYFPQATYALALIYKDSFFSSGVDYANAVASFERLDSILRARAPSASESSLYYSYFDYAELLLVGTENQKALKCIDRFIETSPDYYEMEKVYNARGVALFRIDQYEKAADSFKKAMAANPDYMAPRVNLRGVFLRVNAVEQAMLSHRLGNYEAALKQVDNLLIIATSYLPALRLKGDILRDMGRDGEALDYYQSIVAENPEDPITYGVRLEMARILERQGELKGALEVLGANASRFSKVPNDPTRAEIIRIMDLLQKKP